MTHSSDRLCRALAAVGLLAALFGGAGRAEAVPTEVRTMTGAGNNTANPLWGAAGSNLLRLGPIGYPDGFGDVTVGSEPTPSRANPRDISNRIVAQGSTSIFNNRNLSNFVFQWGQFIDHDINLSQGLGQSTPIVVNDPQDPLYPAIPFNRAIPAAGTGTGPGNPREHINEITSYIDASNIYGSDTARAAFLRTGSDGTLKTSTGNLLPYNTGGFENANENPMLNEDDLFISGDIRVNEQLGLTSMHTLFMREHNRLAGVIAATVPDLPTDPVQRDETIYQMARKIVSGEIQKITFTEFLPAILGPNAPDLTSLTYKDDVNASIANEFSSAMYRFGHTTLPMALLMVEDDRSLVGSVALRNAFFNPDFYNDPNNVNLILHGLASQRIQEIDNKIVDEVRNFLFGPPGAGGLDLASINIQRGRDMGLTDYNSMRVAFGLPAVNSFADISSDPDVQQALFDLYGNVDNIDPWVGALSEDHLPGSSLGMLHTAALLNQFTRLAEGDRFFYLFDPDMLDPDLLSVVDLDAMRLSDVIRMNTDITHLQDNVFFVIPEPVTATLGLIGLAVLGARLCRRRRTLGDPRM